MVHKNSKSGKIKKIYVENLEEGCIGLKTNGSVFLSLNKLAQHDPTLQHPTFGKSSEAPISERLPESTHSQPRVMP